VVNLGAAIVGIAAVFAGVAAMDLSFGFIPACAGLFFIFIGTRRVQQTFNNWGVAHPASNIAQSRLHSK
jgi:hypothetical protein